MRSIIAPVLELVLGRKVARFAVWAAYVFTYFKNKTK